MSLEKSEKQLSQLIKDKKPKTIMQEVKRIFCLNYPQKEFYRILYSYAKILELFNGDFQGYKKCDTSYHDLNHTMDAVLASARLMDGYNLTKKKISVELAVNLLIAALLHDTGYIQKITEEGGTGARFTIKHVQRSVDFLVKNNTQLKINQSDVEIISHIIKSTGLQIKIDKIDFFSPDERIAGSILGSADLLGQMSSRDYLEKLLFLYSEFKEAKIPGFNTEFDILRKTIDFFKITKRKLVKDYGDVYHYAFIHFEERFGIKENLYMKAIKRHIDYINDIILDDRSNFRKKLKRSKK